MDRVRQWKGPLLFVAAIVFVALIIFREVLDPEKILFTTDDNIGALAFVKRSLPGAFQGWWSDGPLMGMASGPLNSNWSWRLLSWLDLKLYSDWVHAIDLGIGSLFFGWFLRLKKFSGAAVFIGVMTAYWTGTNLTLTYAGHLLKYGTLMFAGIALLAIEQTVRAVEEVGGARASGRRAAWAIVSGVSVGLMFVEQVDVALFIGVFLGGYALFRMFPGKGREGRMRLAVLGLMAVASSVAIPYMLNTKRTSVDAVGGPAVEQSPEEKWNFITQWSFPPEDMIDFVAQGYTGWRTGEQAGPYTGRMGQTPGWHTGPGGQQGFRNFKLENVYLGAIPV